MPFFILLTALLLAAGFYVSRRVGEICHAVFSKLKFPLGQCAVWTGLCFVLLGFVRSRLPLGKDVKDLLGILSAYCMGVLLYLFLYLLLADALLVLLRRPLKNCSRASVFVRGGSLFLAVLIAVGGFVHGARVRTVSYDVSLDTAVPIAGFRIALLSDLHLGAVGSEKRLEKTVEAVNALDADLICIAGDLFDNDLSALQDPEHTQALLRSLRARHGVYACPGNHDTDDDFDALLSFLEESNVHLLAEEGILIDARFYLVGRADASPIGNSKPLERTDKKELFAAKPQGLVTMVLDHNPALSEEYQGEADLILSGHTHRGQVFPGNLITAAMYEADYGHHRLSDGTHHIITSGAGTWGPPMRVGSSCEVVCITLSAE